MNAERFKYLVALAAREKALKDLPKGGRVLVNVGEHKGQIGKKISDLEGYAMLVEVQKRYEGSAKTFPMPIYYGYYVLDIPTVLKP